jgi:hypothetical protein
MSTKLFFRVLMSVVLVPLLVAAPVARAAAPVSSPRPDARIDDAQILRILAAVDAGHGVSGASTVAASKAFAPTPTISGSCGDGGCSLALCAAGCERSYYLCTSQGTSASICQIFWTICEDNCDYCCRGR